MQFQDWQTSLCIDQVDVVNREHIKWHAPKLYIYMLLGYRYNKIHAH